jgi:GTP cyclohydrolase I
MNSNVWTPQPGETVEVYDKTRREWRKARVTMLPTRQHPRYEVVFVGEPEHNTWSASFFDLRAFEPPIAHEPTPPDSDAVVVDWDHVEHTPVADVTDGHAHTLEAFAVNDPRREVACKELLSALITHRGHVDPETPGRMARAFVDMTSGYGANIAGMLKTFPVEGDQGVVLVRDVPFASLCEHHVLPFTGFASVAYIPDGKIVGLSKIPRLIRALSRRLQVQERLGAQIGRALDQTLQPKGVMVVLRGRHSCMAIRGVESPGEMVTSFVLGAFREDASARAEVLQLLR